MHYPILCAVLILSSHALSYPLCSLNPLQSCTILSPSVRSILSSYCPILHSVCCILSSLCVALTILHTSILCSLCPDLCMIQFTHCFYPLQPLLNAIQKLPVFTLFCSILSILCPKKIHSFYLAHILLSLCYLYLGNWDCGRAIPQKRNT